MSDIEYFCWTPLDYIELGERLQRVLERYKRELQGAIERQADEWEYDWSDIPLAIDYRRSIRETVDRWCAHLQVPTNSVQKYDHSHPILLPTAESVRAKVNIVQPVTDILATLQAQATSTTVYRPKAFDNVNVEMMRWIRQNPASVDRIHHRTFEALCAEVLKSQGWTVELTKRTRDGGYDILAVSTDALGFRIKMIVECKLYDVANSVGVPMVDRLMGVLKREGGQRAMLITNSRFTNVAWRAWETAVNRNLRLVDRDELFAWLSHAR